MTKDEVAELHTGLYVIYWKEGGISYAGVGMLPDGGRWLAPVNWTHPTVDQAFWKKVLRVRRLHV